MAGRSTGSSVVRQFDGAAASELAIRHRPDASLSDTDRQVAAAYRALADILAGHQASFRDLTCETLFVRDVRRDLPLVLEARARALADVGQSDGAPLPAFIEQAPLAAHARFELLTAAVVPHRRATWSVRDVRAQSTCACAGCACSAARVVRLGEQTTLQTTNVYGLGGDAVTQARSMFETAETLLGQCGMDFRDVVRVWIHLRNIDRDYDALNRARREFFRERGIERPPASTGIGGAPFPDAHDMTMILYAVNTSPHAISAMSSPTLNEAWTYGADFSRGLTVVEANKMALYVSGTASIDEAGHTIHAGNVEAQVDRMLHNIASLLARQGAGFADIVSGIVYLRHPGDAPALRSLLRQRGFDGFPCAVVQADLCRPDLLCEAEAVAMLPL